MSGQLGPVVVPYIVAAIVVEGNRAEWQIVFGILAAIMASTGLVYLVWGSGELSTPPLLLPSLTLPCFSGNAILGPATEEVKEV